MAWPCKSRPPDLPGLPAMHCPLTKKRFLESKAQKVYEKGREEKRMWASPGKGESNSGARAVVQ